MLRIDQLGPAPRIPKQHPSEAPLVNDYLGATALSRATHTAQELAQYKPAAGPQGTSDRPFSVRVMSSPPSAMEVISGMFGTLIGLLGAIGVVIVLVVFFLIRRDDLRDRFIRLVGGSTGGPTHSSLGGCGRAGQPIPLDAIGRQCLSWPFGCAGAVPDWGAQSGSFMGNRRGCAAIRSVCRRMDRRDCSHRAVAGDLRQLAGARADSWAVSSSWNSRSATSWSPGSMASIRACRRWRCWSPLSPGHGCGESQGSFLATPLTVCLLVIGKHVPQLSFLTILLGDEPVFETKRASLTSSCRRRSRRSRGIAGRAASSTSLSRKSTITY